MGRAHKDVIVVIRSFIENFEVTITRLLARDRKTYAGDRAAVRIQEPTGMDHANLYAWSKHSPDNQMKSVARKRQRRLKRSRFIGGLTLYQV